MTKSTEDPRPLGDDGWAPKDAFLCINQVDHELRRRGVDPDGVSESEWAEACAELSARLRPWFQKDVSSTKAAPSEKITTFPVAPAELGGSSAVLQEPARLGHPEPAEAYRDLSLTCPHGDFIETVPVVPVGPGLFRLEEPFVRCDINFGDIVELSEGGEIGLVFPGSYRRYDFYLFPWAFETDGFAQVIDRVWDFGGEWARVGGLLAICLPSVAGYDPTVDLDPRKLRESKALPRSRQPIGSETRALTWLQPGSKDSRPAN